MKMTIVSSDSHCGTAPEAYRPYLEAKYHADLDDLVREDAHFVGNAVEAMEPTEDEYELIDPERAMRDGGDDGAFDLAVRLREMDREGIAAELLIAHVPTALPPFFGSVNLPYRAELRMAGTQAYHRWVVDELQDPGGRVLALGSPGPCLDMEQTLRELDWVADHGFVAVAPPRLVDDPALPELQDRYYTPFWDKCAERGLNLVIHAGHSRPQGQTAAFLQKHTDAGLTHAQILEQLRTDPKGPLALDMRPRRALWQLMLSGVFDRHPDLKLMLAEVRADWIPKTLTHLDERFSRGNTPLTRKPSEYWVSNCYAGPSFIHRSEVELRHEIGIDNIMFGRDYPHREGTWPNTWDWIRDSFATVPVDEAQKMLCDNAVDFFHLDRPKLDAIAARIGPEPEQLFDGPYEINPQLIEHFNLRGGYTKPAETVNLDEIDELFTKDLSLIT